MNPYNFSPYIRCNETLFYRGGIFVIKLVIVDDEKATREGLRDYIPWKELGIGVVEDANDGVNALELALRLKPDIMLCDVRMPRMNGIELATELREKLPDCKIIFLSAYSDKEYLKSAIHLKAVNYVEKPVNLEEVIGVVRETVELCMEERKKKETDTNIRSKLEESTVLVYDKLVTDLTSSHIKREEVLENIKFLKIDFPVEGDYITGIVKFRWQDLAAAEIQELMNSVLEGVDIVLKAASLCFVQGFKDNEHLIIHMNLKEYGNQSRLKTLFIKIKESINEVINKKGMFFIGVGKRSNEFWKCYESYQTAVLVMQKQFFLGYNNVEFYEDRPTAVYCFDESLKKQFVDFLKNDKKEAAIVLLKHIVDDIKRHDNTLVDQVKNIFFNLAICMLKVAEERAMWITDRNDREKYLWEVVSGASTLCDIEEYIINKIELMYELINQKEGKGNTVYDIVKFVNNNYFDENLSIKTIADHTYLTPTYLCLIFKNGTGKTINNHITEVRMEKAKEYLKDRRVKLYEVASKVGYTDANYFAKAFKKLIGLNPSEYRERYIL